MKNNYHTHIYLCNHATGDVEDYVKEAIKHDFSEIGFSDHAPLDKYLHNQSVRMKDKEFPLYLQKIAEYKEKYKDKITVLASVEIEYFPQIEKDIRKLHKSLDYLVLGQHYILKNNDFDNIRSSFHLKTKDELRKYGNLVVQAIESGLFRILAHPDLYMAGYKDWDETAIEVAEMIINSAKKHDILLEINANGIRKGEMQTPQGIRYGYPRIEFWELAAKHNITAIINSDCHRPEHLNDQAIQMAEDIAKKLNITIQEKI